MKTGTALFLAVLLAASAACAQDAAGGMDHGGMDSGSMDKRNAGGTPSSKAFAAAVQTMHESMGKGLTGDADLDFLNGMIPHHQGAIDMAGVALDYGKDPKVKELARRIIEDQEAEIAEMNRWIAERK